MTKPTGFLPNASDMAAFYASPCGQRVVRLLGGQFRQQCSAQQLISIFGPDAVVAGLGYGLPFLDMWYPDIRHTYALMPKTFGPCSWQRGGRSGAALVEADNLPVPEQGIDVLLMVHELEFAADPAHVLREAARVLSPRGRLLLVLPNRTGLWARSEHTPFGHGRPFTRSQIATLLNQCDLVVGRLSGALMMPPASASFINSWPADIIERGAALMPAVAGVMIIEASKSLIEPITGQRRVKTALRQPVLAGVRP